jgi:hypothetical protein
MPLPTRAFLPAIPPPVPFVEPPSAASFVGRSAELEELSRARSQGARVLTLVGPGGIGKTALALRFVRELQGPFGGAAPRVSLGYRADPHEAATAVARALELPIADVHETDAAITFALDGPSPAVLLDGVDGAALGPTIARWVEATNTAIFVVTARAPIGLSREFVLHLGPLPEADALFRLRARAATPGIAELPREQVDPLVEALGRLPQLVELCAALVRYAPLEDVLAGAQRAARATEPHAATLAWLWGHLDATEQRTLAALSIEQGTLSLELASALVGESALPSGAPLGEVVLGASAKGWLHLRLRPGESPLLLLPESLRCFASGQLDAQEARRLEARRPKADVEGPTAAIDARLVEAEAKLVAGHLAEATARFLDLARAKEPRTALASAVGLTLVAAERGTMAEAEKHAARLRTLGAGALVARANAIASLGLALGWLAAGDAQRAGPHASSAFENARRGAHPAVANIAGACRAAVLALTGELAKAEAQTPCSSPGCADACDSLRALVCLARSRATGEALPESVERLRSELGARSETLDWSARLAFRALERALDGPPEETPKAPLDGGERVLVVPEDAAWFQMGRGGPVVTLSRRLPLRRLLAALCDAHVRAPGAAVPWRELVDAGWPDEKITPEAARNRLQVGLATLRTMGLRDHVERDGHGYRLGAITLVRSDLDEA